MKWNIILNIFLIFTSIVLIVVQQPKKKDWRRQHEEFIRNIRAARGATNAIKSGELPPPPEPSVNPDYIQCEYCNRRFNESAAERHINFCKEQKSRLPKSSSDSKYDQKKQKQAMRTKVNKSLSYNLLEKHCSRSECFLIILRNKYTGHIFSTLYGHNNV